MHFHLPKPLHGWREFVGEVGIIVVGVLIALSAEQIIELRHWHTAAKQASAAIEAELAEQEGHAIERLAVQRCLTGQLNALYTRLAAYRGGEWKGMPMAVSPGAKDASVRMIAAAYRAPERLWLSDAWETARSNGVLNHLPASTVSEFAEAYSSGNSMRLFQTEENEAAAKLVPLALDGPIDAQDRAAFLQALATVDHANGEMVYNANRELRMLRKVLRDFHPEAVDKVIADIMVNQRAFRGACVQPLKLNRG
jgi:hypothetical protein